jgi:hypothetical protein
MPRGYFDENTVDVLTALRERALCDRREELLADFPAARAERSLANTWRSAAACNLRQLAHVFVCAKRESIEERPTPKEFARLRSRASPPGYYHLIQSPFDVSLMRVEQLTVV